MVEGLPGSDFAGVKAGVKQYSPAYKHGGGSGAVWRRGLFACIARCFIVRGVFLCSEDALRKILSVFFRVNSAEKCDLTRGVVLFSDHMWCYCVPVHGNCGFWHTKLAAYLTGNNVALWVFRRERKALRRYFRGSVWAF